jgi:26S proteasome regulatory subunit N12
MKLTKHINMFSMEHFLWNFIFTIFCSSHICSSSGMIPPSPDEYPILGLNLLRLLVDNKIADFHTELELLPLEALNHPCIKYVVDLEQSFMEGFYNRLSSARGEIPHDSYVYFMDHLAETVR